MKERRRATELRMASEGLGRPGWADKISCVDEPSEQTGPACSLTTCATARSDFSVDYPAGVEPCPFMHGAPFPHPMSFFKTFTLLLLQASCGYLRVRKHTHFRKRLVLLRHIMGNEQMDYKGEIEVPVKAIQAVDPNVAQSQ